jgi:pyruvate dehydrogenase E2 component (dihydrolipoamide acetyltransferase)
MPAFRSRDPKREMREGTLVQWRVCIGDKLFPGRVIAEIETGLCLFATHKWQAPLTATVVELLTEPGETVAVGSPLLIVDESPT